MRKNSRDGVYYIGKTKILESIRGHLSDETTVMEQFHNKLRTGTGSISANAKTITDHISEFISLTLKTLEQMAPLP